MEQEVKETPTYRLPAGLKREAIYKKKLPGKSITFKQLVYSI